MTKFEPRSIVWTAARKEFLKSEKSYCAYKNAYTEYKAWLGQFGAREVNQCVVFNNDEDALAFKLKFAFNG